MVAELTTGALIVFALIGLALLFFVTEWLPPDMTALGVLVSLAVLEPYTGVTASEALLGFASPATVTIIAMYILSAGIEVTGVVDYIGAVLADVTGGDERKLLGATVGTTGAAAGFVNNTPVVAVFIPMITGLSDRYHVSPSKFLLPMSFAAMLGGTLTLVGTATNLLASDFADELLGESLSMFQFTPVGVVVLVVGLTYLMTVGRLLVPERVAAHGDFTEEFDMDRYLGVLEVREGSPLVGRTVRDALRDDGLAAFVAEPPTDASDDSAAAVAPSFDLDVLQIDRNGESFFATGTDQPLEPGDTLTVRGSVQSRNRFADFFQLRQRSRESVTEDLLAQTDHPGTLYEAVVHGDSRLIGRTLADARFRSRFDTTVLAIKRGEEVIRDELADVEFARGDTLLVQTTSERVEYLQEGGYLVVTEGPEEPYGPHQAGESEDGRPELDSRATVAIGLLVGVVAVAALDLVSVTIAALGGVVLLVGSGIVSTSRAYDAVSWNVVFLLAGLLPLGLAMRHTGGADFVASLLALAAETLPALGVLGLFYLVTAVLASIVTPVATVVLLVPIAVDTAQRLDLNGLAFLLVVMFAASNAFLTPIGYQTNLMVYGPGGYRFTDYARVGAPLQLLLAVVTTLSVALWFGL